MYHGSLYTGEVALSEEIRYNKTPTAIKFLLLYTALEPVYVSKKNICWLKTPKGIIVSILLL